MSEVKQDVKTENTNTAEVKEQSVEQNVKQEMDSIPYSRFAEKVKQTKELQEKLQEFEDLNEKKRIADLERKGEYETLLADMKGKYEDAKIKAEQFDSYVSNRKESILSTYSEEEQDILGDLSLAKLEKYHESKINQNKVAVDKSRGGVSKSAPTDFHKMSVEEKSDPKIWQGYLDSFRRK